MKKRRKFYPRQVLYQLAGKDTVKLSDNELHALKFFICRSRRYNIIVSLLQDNPAVCNAEYQTAPGCALSLPLCGHTRVFVANPIQVDSFDMAYPQ